MEGLIARELSALVAEAAAGDEIAFARIVAAHHDDMVRVAYLVAGDPDLARDAVQTAWAVAWVKLTGLREADRLRPWLVSIAANEARQILRGRARRAVREVAVDAWSGESVTPSPDPGTRAGLVDLANALRGLSPNDRALIAMRYAVGLSSREIGEVVGMTGGGVRARLGRLLDRLREDLGDE